MIQIVASDYGFITRLVFSKLQAAAIVHAACNYYQCSYQAADEGDDPAPNAQRPIAHSQPRPLAWRALAGVTHKNIYIEFENVSLIRVGNFCCSPFE